MLRVKIYIRDAYAYHVFGILEAMDEKHKPAAQSQYVECVYIGGNKIAMRGMTMQGTN